MDFNDDTLQIVSCLLIISIVSILALPPDYAEKIIIGVCSGLAGIAKGKRE